MAQPPPKKHRAGPVPLVRHDESESVLLEDYDDGRSDADIEEAIVHDGLSMDLSSSINNNVSDVVEKPAPMPLPWKFLWILLIIVVAEAVASTLPLPFVAWLVVDLGHNATKIPL